MKPFKLFLIFNFIVGTFCARVAYRLMVLFFLFPPLASAQTLSASEMSYGLQASSYAASLLAASPPLPMLFMKPRTNRYSIQPGYVEGKLDALDSTSNHRAKGAFYGGGGALGFNHAFSDSLGWYFIAFGHGVGGDFSSIQESGCSGQCTQTEMKDIKATFGAAGVGLNWTFLGGTSSSFLSAGVFAGPAVTTASMSQRVVRTDNLGVMTDDFEMKMNPTFATALFGLQVGLKFGEWLLLNPYLMANWVFNDQCQNYEVTKVNVAGTLAGQSTPTCGGPNNGNPGTTNNQIEMKGDVAAIGVNLGFPAIGVTANVYSMPSVPYKNVLREIKANAYVVSLSIETN